MGGRCVAAPHEGDTANMESLYSSGRIGQTIEKEIH